MRTPARRRARGEDRDTMGDRGTPEKMLAHADRDDEARRRSNEARDDARVASRARRADLERSIFRRALRRKYRGKPRNKRRIDAMMPRANETIGR